MRRLRGSAALGGLALPLAGGLFVPRPRTVAGEARYRRLMATDHITDRSQVSQGRGMPSRWLAWAGAVLAVAVMVPPVEVLARRYLYLESIQFCVLAVIAPALIVLGAPRRGAWTSPGRPGARIARAALFLCAWIGACLVWRLPPVLDGLARHPALALAELATLLPAGIFVWLELAGPKSSGPLLARPWRAIVAAFAMWAIWIIAYILGFSRQSVVHAYHSGSLGTVNDQEIAALVLWLVSALSFVPFIFIPVLTWLRDGADPREEGRRAPGLGVRGWSKWAR